MAPDNTHNTHTHTHTHTHSKTNTSRAHARNPPLQALNRQDFIVAHRQHLEVDKPLQITQLAQVSVIQLEILHLFPPRLVVRVPVVQGLLVRQLLPAQMCGE